MMMAKKKLRKISDLFNNAASIVAKITVLCARTFHITLAHWFADKPVYRRFMR